MSGLLAAVDAKIASSVVFTQAGTIPCRAGKGYIHFDAVKASQCRICHPELSKLDEEKRLVRQAAPDLLEALEELEALGSLELPQRRDAALLKAKAAIAKAKGEQP